ncbi:STAS domain-containing protein [Novosphingobium sp. KCTC 2891]|uniref:STAS domain-containing protein n=1 Tax=Novosphingobium sp. KCTC 2891 TaxID=2989730 RepID=UPI002221337E|nr:STAS domain-containing protein [Novosphingobium sp. KCTC 2891]MCW1383024.1 STAS domain-containing protein [Novosphingobium sp. KCTC 2891]
MPTITLPSRCDRAAAEALLPEMVAALGSGALHIDARECTQIGQAMLQVLISARRTGDGALIDASPVLRDTARQLGLDAELFDETMLHRGVAL